MKGPIPFISTRQVKHRSIILSLFCDIEAVKIFLTKQSIMEMNSEIVKKQCLKVIFVTLQKPS